MYFPPTKTYVKNNLPNFAWREHKEKRKKRIIISELLTDYSSNATLHGVAYIGAKDKTLPEKIWWIVTFTMSVCFCAYLIGDTWIKWKENPIILSFTRQPADIWEIPFPAVTICPAAPQRENVIEGTIWSKVMDKTLLSDILTEEGLCFAFNIVSQEDMFTDELSSAIPRIKHKMKNTGWSLEKGYKHSTNIKNDYPRRAITSGISAGLSVHLKSKFNRDFVCGEPIDGFKLMLHNPMELPKTQLEYYFIPPDKKTIVILKPEMIVTSENIRSMPLKIRKCYFPGEKILRFFRTYTNNNCILECFTNITLHVCGCVSIFMPRDRHSRICGFPQMKCIENATIKYLSYKMNEEGLEVSKNEHEKSGNEIYHNCACLPACFNLKFTAEISHAKLNISKSLIASGVLENITTTNNNKESDGMEAIAHVEIFFKESEFLVLQRNELYGKTDFLANCGGLLGLFLGFSILSLIEIVYFLTLRLWFKLQQK